MTRLCFFPLFILSLSDPEADRTLMKKIRMQLYYSWKSQDRALYYVFINYERYGCFFSAILEFFLAAFQRHCMDHVSADAPDAPTRQPIVGNFF